MVMKSIVSLFRSLDRSHQGRIGVCIVFHAAEFPLDQFSKFVELLPVLYHNKVTALVVSPAGRISARFDNGVYFFLFHRSAQEFSC